MAGIFYLSSRSDPLAFLPSSKYVASVDRFAHASEYAGLAFLLHRALKEHGSGRAGGPRDGGTEERGSIGALSFAPWRLSLSAVIALVYAILDEFHQSFVPGRGFQLADIGYDLAGIIVALGLVGAREKKR